VLTSSSPPLQATWTAVGGVKAYRVHIVSTDLLDVYVYAASSSTSVTIDAGPWANILATMVGSTATLTVEAHEGSARHVSAPITLTVTK
jgi:hypothetical protein